MKQLRMRHSQSRAGRGRTARAASGLSIVELMIGIAIGLFILAGATLVLTTQLGDNRRLLLETQVQQDLRAAADLIARDVRRAGYWGNAADKVWPANVNAALASPYEGVTEASASSLSYDKSSWPFTPSSSDNGSWNEQSGFRLNAETHTIEMLLGAGGWQALTDPAVLRVIQFEIGLQERHALPEMQCPDAPCNGPGGCPLKHIVRQAEVTISAVAVHDPAVTRTLQQTIRLRNDVTREVCPPSP